MIRVAEMVWGIVEEDEAGWNGVRWKNGRGTVRLAATYRVVGRKVSWYNRRNV